MIKIFNSIFNNYDLPNKNKQSHWSILGVKKSKSQIPFTSTNLKVKVMINAFKISVLYKK